MTLSFHPLPQEQRSSLPLRLQPGNPAVVVADLLGKFFQSLARASYLVSEF